MDGEVASKDTKLGKDLMRLRRNAMKRTSPSYNKEDIWMLLTLMKQNTMARK